MKLILPNRNHRQTGLGASIYVALLTLLAAGAGVGLESNVFGQTNPAAPSAAKTQPIPLADPNSPASAPSDAAKQPAGPTGEQLVRDSAASLAKLPGLSARIRQKIDLYGVQLAGTGSYLQLGTGDDMLLRMSVKVQVEKHVTSLQQVCDGRFLWLRRDMPDGTSLERIDLKPVREAWSGGKIAAGEGPWLAVGGLPRLVEGIAAKYEFGPPKAVKLGNMPAWLLEGTWRVPATVPGEKSATPGEAVPKRAALVIGQEDRFPYRIEFQRREKKPAEDDPHPWKPVMTLELYEVEIGANSIDPLQFVYKPDNQKVTDATEPYLRKLGVKGVETARKPGEKR